MSPSKIVNARVHNFQIAETQIELSEIVEVALAECTAVFGSGLTNKGKIFLNDTGLSAKCNNVGNTKNCRDIIRTFAQNRTINV